MRQLRRLDRRSMLALGAASALAAAAGPRRAMATDGSGAYIDVPAYAQQRNLSCEYACCTIASAAFGGWISEYEFDARGVVR